MAKKTVKSNKNRAEDVKVKGLEIKLGMLDRVVIPNQILPQEGDIVTLTIARDIVEKIKITQNEMTKTKMKENGDGGLKWKGEIIKLIEFTNAEYQLLKKQVNILDSQKKITPELLDTCIKLSG